MRLGVLARSGRKIAHLSTDVPAHKSSRRIAARGSLQTIGPKILSSDRGGFRSGCCSAASEKES